MKKSESGRQSGRHLAMIGATVAAIFILAARGNAEGIGERIADFNLQDQWGRSHRLSQYAGKPVVLVFWSFKCPVALAAGSRLDELRSRFGDRVSFLAVASNNNESRAEIERNAENLRLTLPVLIDSDGALADRMGATHAPAAIAIDGQGILRFRGTLEAARRGGDGARALSLEAALTEVLAARALSVPETRQTGCVIRKRS